MFKLKKGEFISVVIILALLAVSVWAYPQLPERVASHWDASGRVNGYMTRFWGAFFMPLLSVVMLVIFMVVPAVDPKRHNIENFRPYYDRLVVGLILFIGYIHLLTLAWNLGFKFDLLMLMIPAFAALFYGLGGVIAKAEPNWSVGIRTPWTLSDDRVWRRTHDLGGNLFKATGLLSLLGLFWPSLIIWFLVAPILAVSLFLTVYSYVLFRRLNRPPAGRG